jgi:hypothetical protein
LSSLQLSASVFEQILLKAIKITPESGGAWGQEVSLVKRIQFYMQRPGVQQLGSAALAGLLTAAVEQENSNTLQDLLQYPPALQLSSEDAAAVVATALEVEWTGGICWAIMQQVNPQDLSDLLSKAVRLAALNQQGMPRCVIGGDDSCKTVKQLLKDLPLLFALCYSEAVQQLAWAQLEPALLTAAELNSHRALAVLMHLPAAYRPANQAVAETAGQILGIAVQYRNHYMIKAVMQRWGELLAPELLDSLRHVWAGLIRTDNRRDLVLLCQLLPKQLQEIRAVLQEVLKFAVQLGREGAVKAVCSTRTAAELLQLSDVSSLLQYAVQHSCMQAVQHLRVGKLQLTLQGDSVLATAQQQDHQQQQGQQEKADQQDNSKLSDDLQGSPSNKQLKLCYDVWQQEAPLMKLVCAAMSAGESPAAYSIRLWHFKAQADAAAAESSCRKQLRHLGCTVQRTQQQESAVVSNAAGSRVAAVGLARAADCNYS